ncbi:MAG: type IV toxin-antitoxin system AbiEi family antitoxin domain-containing protein [Actinomycetes bacterium]
MTARQELWDVAVDQYGYFTVQGALDLGIERLTVDKLASRGQVERAGHGVYRFPELPVTKFDPYMLAVLWTGAPEACLSHDTALAVREVCDINPDRIHLTVAARRRIRRAGGELYSMHYEDLDTGQVDWWERIPTVTLPTAIGQCVASGVSTYLLRQALDTGRRTGALLPGEADELEAALEVRDVAR